ncbi:hypothetical protein ACIBI3_20425 [Actinomadura luteofluorescens]|uniref:hypothetical protein n=1 Tax=Actinomadura luteofluorescens TaxID=46163 RepID=UPI0034730450
MEETFTLQKSSFGQSGRVTVTFAQSGPQHEDALLSHRYGRADDRDVLLKTALSPAGAKVLRREAEVYDRIGGRQASAGRMIGFQTAQSPVCLMVTRRGVPVSRCEPAPRLDDVQLGRAARDLFGALAFLADLGFAHRAVSADTVFWDGRRVELHGFGHVEPLGPPEALAGSALGTPTGLPVSDVPDVRAAAHLLLRLATGSPGGGPPAALVAELAEVDAGLAQALEPAFHAAGGPGASPGEIKDRLWRSRPKPPPSGHVPEDRHDPAAPPREAAPAQAPPSQASPAQAPPRATPQATRAEAGPSSAVRDRRLAAEEDGRAEFRELRRRQRTFRQSRRIAAEPPREQAQAGPVAPPWTARPPATDGTPPGGGRAPLLFLLLGVLAVALIVSAVLLVR